MEAVAESSAAAAARQVMPGSFDPGDYVDFLENSFEELADIQDYWHNKERASFWSTRNMPEMDSDAVVNWYQYGPPAALRKTPNVTSQILIDLVESSLETVAARASEEARRAQEQEEQKQRTESAHKSSGEPYLPIIISAREPTPPPSPPQRDTLAQRRAEAVLAVDSSQSPGRMRRSKSPDKPLKLNLRRLFGHKDVKSLTEIERAPKSSFGLKFLGSPKAGSGLLGPPDVLSGVVQPRTKVAEKVEQPAELVECVSCFDEFSIKKMVKVPCHSYCFECFAALISTSCQNEQQWPPKCCLNEIPFRTILRYVPGELKKKYKDRSDEWNVPAGDRVYCSRTDCGLWIKPDRINSRDQEGRCERGHWTCTICRAPRHPDQACAQDQNMIMTNELAEEQGWKKCGKCRALVEHTDACRHMTCRCGYEFCYVCGQVWCTCRCTGDQLTALKNAASERRRQREIRERELARRQAEQAEELRQILAEIEEFEREVALKEEMLRQEQERLEQEARQREIEERVRQESIRRVHLEEKFSVLRSDLELLHELQMVMMESRHEEESTMLVDQMEAAKKQLTDKHAKTREDLARRIQEKMEEKSRGFDGEFVMRSAAEKKMMKEYQTQLEEHWHGRPNGRQEIAKAMAPLETRMKQALSQWQTWKAQELETYRKRIEEESVIREEYMYSEKVRLYDRFENQETERAKRTAAELKWLHLVVVERERILGQMEMDEVEGDADSLFASEASESGLGENSSTEKAADIDEAKLGVDVDSSEAP